MPEQKTLEQAYADCEVGGYFQYQYEVDIDKIKVRTSLSGENAKAAEKLMKGLEKNSLQWSVVYTLLYDSLRELADALLVFYKIKIPNHQCLFAYLCKKHSDLDFSWDFFEKIRTKRNGINYYGSPAKYQDFKEIELQLKLYIKTLKEKIELKLKSS